MSFDQAGLGSRGGSLDLMGTPRASLDAAYPGSMMPSYSGSYSGQASEGRAACGGAACVYLVHVDEREGGSREEALSQGRTADCKRWFVSWLARAGSARQLAAGAWCPARRPRRPAAPSRRQQSRPRPPLVWPCTAETTAPWTAPGA